MVDLEDDPGVLVQAASGPRLWFRRVPEPERVKSCIHLDVRDDDRRVEVERLVTRGATVIEDRPAEDLTVLADPEGNEFCVIDGPE